MKRILSFLKLRISIFNLTYFVSILSLVVFLLPCLFHPWTWMEIKLHVCYGYEIYIYNIFFFFFGHGGSVITFFPPKYSSLAKNEKNVMLPLNRWKFLNCLWCKPNISEAFFILNFIVWNFTLRKAYSIHV